MKKFTKQEILSLVVIFLVLILVSFPNFKLSLRRARDQVRRDDIGNIQGAIDAYYNDYGIYPASTEDGKMVICTAPNTTPTTDAKGNPVLNLIPCNWSKDRWVSVTPGVSKVYMSIFPGDPHFNQGVSYVYFSDGSRYQLFGSLESADEAGYDAKLEARGVKCGAEVCNIGRAHNVPMYITIEEYNLEVHCTAYPKDLKCLNRHPANEK